jgi:hypothetical protein
MTKRLVLFLLVFVPVLQAQDPTGSGTANYIAKWSSTSNLTTSALCQSATGGKVGIATCFPTQRLQVNSGDALVKGVNNFTASGQVARYFIGDANHALGAAFGAGLFLSTYTKPYAMVIQDKTGFVGIGTTKPTSLLTVSGIISATQVQADVLASNIYSGVLSGSKVTGSIFIADGCASSLPLCPAYHATAGSVEIDQPNAGIIFSDGTVQTTAYRGTTAANTADAIRQLQHDRDSLVQVIRQLQARVARLEKARR